MAVRPWKSNLESQTKKVKPPKFKNDQYHRQQSFTVTGAPSIDKRLEYFPKALMGNQAD
jgi:hypothetical protein